MPGKRSPRQGAKRPARVREAQPEFPVASTQSRGVYYLESSALLAALLEGDAGLRALLSMDLRFVTSALTFAECRRGVVRARQSARISAGDERAAIRVIEDFRPRCAVVPVSVDLLERVGRRFPVEPVRTLDGIHLASLEMIGAVRGAITVITRDQRVRENVVQMGFLLA